MKLQFRHSLSLKLLRVVLLCALLVGVLLSVGQIILDVYKTRQVISSDAQSILAMFRDPSTQAIYSLDREMGMQVIEGLLQHEAVRHASIGHANEPVLAENGRSPLKTRWRWLTDPILGAEAEFSIPLISRGPYSEHYGDLHLTLDTAPYGLDWLINSVIIFISGVLRALFTALVLYLIYHWMITKPLAQMIDHLSDINPDHPGESALPTPQGHENNELGLWVRTANGLLSSIERNSRLRQEAEHSLQKMGEYDFLTRLPNRLLFQQQLDAALEDSARLQHRAAVLCLGLDNFKDVNERFGYEVGDQLLMAVSERLRTHGARLCALARLGGDQFALVQNQLEEPYQAAELAQKVLDDLEEPLVVGDSEIRLRATLGISLFPEDGDSAEKLLQKAEQTMTLAKARSRNRYQFYIASVDTEMRRRRELEQDLHRALEHNQLFLVYQPQIDYQSRRVVGVEALLRWKHPEHGLVPPDVFIGLAEQNGSILRIGGWVLEQACAELRNLIDLGFDSVRMAVNLSAVQLRHAELPQLVSGLLERYQLPPASLELEVTETGLMEDIDSAKSNLLALREAGALIAIDDFGTGYSSLSYLKSLPLDKIKIDRSFVRDLLTEHSDATIVRTIIQLGHSLGMRVIAEGVETPEQEAYIIRQRCEEGQGYLYSRPLPIDELLSYLRDQNAGFAAARALQK